MSAYVEVAAEIGRRLGADAIWHGGRCNWIGVSPSNTPEEAAITYAALGPDLYAGTGGIALFLGELHAAIGDTDAALAARGAISQGLDAADRMGPGALGLYDGRLGIALAAARIGELLGMDELRERAAALALASEPGDNPEIDLISGRAGAIVASLVLGRLLDHPELDLRAQRLGEELMSAAEWRDGACSWPPPPLLPAAGNLCGLSHGAAGAALALLELHRATGDLGYRTAAEGALAYERGLYDPAERNWPDLRDFTGWRESGSGPSYRAAWCHGAPGIAVSRLRAWEVLEEEVARSEARAALETTARVVRAGLRGRLANYSLCHGLAGNAEVAAEGEDVLPGGRALAHEVAGAGIERFASGSQPWPCGTPHGETPGLMLGLAGIGLFLLRLADPTVPSVLLPRPETWLGTRPLRPLPSGTRAASGASGPKRRGRPGPRG